MPPGVWQPAHLLAKIGATLFQVGAPTFAQPVRHSLSLRPRSLRP